ncbi:hypothetical protein GC174_14830 [bacterium]|nr:hypothetical protein [bacterium]
MTEEKKRYATLDDGGVIWGLGYTPEEAMTDGKLYTKDALKVEEITEALFKKVEDVGGDIKWRRLPGDKLALPGESGPVIGVDPGSNGAAEIAEAVEDRAFRYGGGAEAFKRQTAAGKPFWDRFNEAAKAAGSERVHDEVIVPAKKEITMSELNKLTGKTISSLCALQRRGILPKGVKKGNRRYLPATAVDIVLSHKKGTNWAKGSYPKASENGTKGAEAKRRLSGDSPLTENA